MSTFCKASIDPVTVAAVFLSYRHEGENPKHVRRLAERLEQAGLSVVLDQFAQEREFNGGGPDEGWVRWSKAQAGKSDHKVLIVGSAGWFRCYEQLEVPGTGLGAAAEAGVIEQRLYNQSGISSDIRIVIFTELDPVKDIPLDLQRYQRFLDPRDFSGLVRWLAGEGTVSPDLGWPLNLPNLHWSMADHHDVRDAFAKLITEGAPFRYLPIVGPSETGKSRITRLVLGNAFHFSGIACGRFDFKGATDVESELQRFTQHLGIAMPESRLTVTSCLNDVLRQLRAAAKPTILIFDTFEAVDVVTEKWIRDDLLISIVREKWLRVVIAGQRVPLRTGEAWEHYAHPAITLKSPDPKDWFTFGREHKPEITLEFVEKVYHLSRGKASLLAQLFGPSA